MIEMASSSSSSNPRKIQRVPDLLVREDVKKKENDYYPKVVSIGPYHRGKPELAQVEAFKPRAVELFLRGHENPQEYFFSHVLGMINDVRNCYEESINYYLDEELAHMMLCDASLIIIEMEVLVGTQNSKELYPKILDMIQHLGRLTIATLFHDFFLLENQIPFAVMELLIRLRYEEGTRERMIIHTYVNLCLFGEKRHREIPSQAEEVGPLHLLEVMHRILVADSNACLSRHEVDENWAAKRATHSFRTVTDLKAKGIHFSPSTTQSLRDVNFESGFFYATLQLPEWFVSPNTKSLFKNLVAYEMLPGVLTEPVVTAYIGLMQSLVESREDVKELRERRILYHQLRSDEEVVNVYKGINSRGARHGRVFFVVREEIQAHYNNRLKTWMAELILTKFRSPWTVIAFLAAAVVVVLTAAHFHYTLHPRAPKKS